LFTFYSYTLGCQCKQQNNMCTNQVFAFNDTYMASAVLIISYPLTIMEYIG